MKRFIWFLLLAAAAYAVYRYYPELEKRAKERTGADGAAAKKPSAPIEIPESLPGSPPVRRPAPTPSSATSPTPAAGAPSAPAAGGGEIAARFPMPEFKTIEELTGQWKAIPPTAFPREVTLKADLNCRLGVGGTVTSAAGARAVALSASEGVLTLAPNAESKLRGQLPVEKTDLREVLADVYEKFKLRKRAEVTKARQKAEADAQRSTSIAAALSDPGADPPSNVLAKIGRRPPQNADRTVPAMLDSMTRGDVKEIKAKDASGWGTLHFSEVEGEPYWVGSVRYTARTIFGEFPTEALALIRNGRVLKWVYAGTGEPVPEWPRPRSAP